MRQYGISRLQQPGVAKQIVIYASAVGSLTSTKLGAITAQPTAKEVETFLDSYLPKNWV